MVPVTMRDLSHLSNPLVSASQLETSATQHDGVPSEIEASVRFETSRILQAAGILLRLPQDLIAQAVVILHRFWVGPDGESMLEFDAEVVAATALYLTAKPSAHSVTPRQMLTAFRYLTGVTGHRPNLAAVAQGEQLTSESNKAWHLTEGDYEIARNRLYEIELCMLRSVGFQTHVALPYNICVNYLQTFDVFNEDATGSAVAQRAFAYLNTALLSPQLLYLTHQPSAIATAAIYIAARETGAKLPEVEWWEVFDVDREELGFLVVALQSVEGFATEEKRIWGRRKVPLTVEELQAELERRSMLEEGM